MKKYIILMLFCFLGMTSILAANVEKGSRGAEVLEIQELLIAQGYLEDKADGIFGSKTEAAVRRFQNDKNLKISGIVDDQVKSLLKKHKENKKSQIDKVLEMGARGDQVLAIQHRLVLFGISPGAIDGVYGKNTMEAIKRFQRLQRIQETGKVDAKTYELLQKKRQPPSSYKKKMTMEATAYTAYDPGNGQYTARGNLLRRGLVSVDPSIIPLGTELYIEEYGYAIADDTGGAIQGARIDLAMDSRDEAFQFGRRDVQVYILN